MSQCTQVAYVSQQLFIILAYKFKNHIKDEISAFMTNVFFRVVGSENSSFTQKAVALESLRSLCNDPFLLSQIFLNYDCDFDSMNLYKDIVFHLSQLCAKSSIASFEPAGRSKQKDAEENAELTLAGTEIMVTILQAFLEALNIPTDDEETIDTAGKKIRKDLHIEEVMISSTRRASNFLKYRQKNLDFKNSVLSTATRETAEANGTAGSTDESFHNSFGSNHRNRSTGSLSFAENGSQSRMVTEDLTGTILGFFEKKRNAEQNLELGVVKFTMDLKKGLKFFIDNGFVTCDAKEIARFFLAHKDRLDKTQMGEVLGREPDSAFIKGKPDLDPDKGGPGFFCRILHHYAMALDFADMFFAEAIRLFLSGFRLPGEAQKIDRIMEKFAERYTLKNPDVFPSADTAFILAFSVIMLNTDLHNPSIKPERRMTIESFIRNNRGIGENGADLDPELLTKIFNRIKEKPFSLKEDDAAREKVAQDATQLLGDNGGLLGAGLIGGTTVEERKKEKFRKEREDMLTATELLIRRKKGRSAKTEHLTDDVDPALVVKPMFDVTWGALIGSLSQVMEISNDNRAIAVCLKGFVYAIRISAHSNMSLTRDTFLGSLAKSSYLGSVKQLKDKNIEVMRTIINIAITDGEYLGESWGPVLQCISQIASMRMSASGLDNDETFLQDSTHSGGSITKKESAANRKTDLLKETETANSLRVLNAISEQLIDQVFSSSVKLSAESLAHFIEQLIAVANSEIEGDSKSGITGVSTSATGSNHGESGLSIFSMQRLVEVADYNMHIRPRLVWARIWGIMSDFFTKNGSHSNPMVSVFAVDALKQLSLKFLEKAEAPEFHFQKLFLKPFLLVMKNNGTRQETKEVILACVDQMINTRVDNIRSGWKVFFEILQVGAKDPNNRVSRHALSILQGTLDNHLDRLGIFAKEEDAHISRNSNAEDFLAMCKASLSFMARHEGEASQPVSVFMRALCHAAIYADLIASKKVLPPVSGSQFDVPDASGYTYEGLDDQEALEMVLWRPLFEGLANGIRDSTSSHTEGDIGNLLQSGSVLTLRVILLRHKALFTCNQLQAILKDTVIPAFQAAVKDDRTPVTTIASDSPSISSLDFLADPLPIPPDSDDAGLLKFQSVVQQSDRNPRPMGPAELLLEATFTVMRNGGGYDLSEAHKFAKKDIESKDNTEQPFPDSWISTTAPIALGTLTDISTEILLLRGAEGATVWRCTVAEIYQHWCNGDITKWVPCEAVVRIATTEFERCITRGTENLSQLGGKANAKVWANNLVDFYAEIMGKNLGMEQVMMELLLEEKCKVINANSKSSSNDSKVDVQPPPPSGKLESDDLSSSSSSSSSSDSDSNSNSDSDSDSESDSDENETPSSEATDSSNAGPLDSEAKKSVDEKKECHEHVEDAVNNDKTEFNGTAAGGDGIASSLPRSEDEASTTGAGYGKIQRPNFERSELLSAEAFSKLDEKFNLRDSPKWMRYLPALKLRCVAAHYLQKILLSLREEQLIGFISQQAISNLLKILNMSRGFAEAAVKNEELAHAFQEAMFSEWGISDDMGEEALENVARLNNTQGSAMFFLTQTASATNGVIRLLSDLYDHEETMDGEYEWDRRMFAGQYLLKIKQDIFRKFTESEAKEGHKVDPNVWRNATESGVKVAIYCTSFASVVVGLLKAMLSFEPALIERNKADIFPLVCELVGVRSEEIRKLVRRVLTEKFGPLLGLGQDDGGKLSMRDSIESKASFV
mmetsp:Transcript_7450/g.21709  ORF Transcript_7450/g.21709 Transcript_7450/m.21709 type:complete len:1742 (-) Transcript_7450:1355-6580(-)